MVISSIGNTGTLPEFPDNNDNEFGYRKYRDEIKSISFSGNVWTPLFESNFLFCGLDKVVSIDVTNLNTSLSTDLRHMFYNCKSLKEVKINNLNVTMVSSVAGMFSGCESLEKIDLSNWNNTSNLCDMRGMFRDCK